MVTFYILPQTPTGNGRRIILSGTDLIFTSIKSVFVYSVLDVDRLKQAISRTLSFWPILTGRIFVDRDEYQIEFSDQAIPLTYAENEEIEYWPNMRVLVDDTVNLEPYIDYVLYKPQDEPLIRFKLTKLTRSGEFILGISFSHVVGDAASNIHFLRDLSRCYQGLYPNTPHPIFERCLLNSDEVDSSILPALKALKTALKYDIATAKRIQNNAETVLVTLCFTSKQIAALHKLVGSDNQEITPHDALNAYIIVILNNHLLLEAKEYFKHASIVIDYRGISASLAPVGHVANSFITVVSPDFTNPLSVLDVAKTIRKTIQECRNQDFLLRWFPAANHLMKQIIHDGKVPYTSDVNDIIINSNFKHDWAGSADLGMQNQCRFHTATSFESYFRIFRSNPYRNSDDRWYRDHGAAEVAFRVKKGGIKETILASFQRDLENHFVDIKR